MKEQSNHGEQVQIGALIDVLNDIQARFFPTAKKPVFNEYDTGEIVYLYTNDGEITDYLNSITGQPMTQKELGDFELLSEDGLRAALAEEKHDALMDSIAEERLDV